MAKVTLNCPNCGAPVEFSWASSVQATCPYCNSVLVRTDVDVKKVGEVGDLPNDSSPIQMGTEGIYKDLAFVVAGRIIYEYENGGWNEWHIVFNDGTSGWLSDAQLEYVVSTEFKGAQNIPPAHSIQVGKEFRWGDQAYEVTSVTQANYKGVEGQLPFQFWDADQCTFADLRTTQGRFGTIDYSDGDDKPVVYIGDAVDYNDLKLKNVREFEGWTK
jgi:hypothetical protein